MAADHFRFKRFQVQDEGAAHKVGTDGVLLGSWVTIRDTDRLLLDIGTGSGVIALMLAQRSHHDAHIDAVEIEESDVLQARENVAQSPWPLKVTVHHTALQEFSALRQYDVIVSNPPFFVNSLQPPDKRRVQARHTLALSFDHLVESAARLLRPQGSFAIVLPSSEGEFFVRLATEAGLFPQRLTNFRTRPHKAVERLLAEFSPRQEPVTHTELTLYEEAEKWTPEYRALTRDFYLKA